jgi:hypothetical protein
MFSFCSHESRPRNDDGQLHTLGLLERLRSETNLVQGAYAGLYERVDKLLRELENPNLHDIRNMSFRVELWDRHALHIRWVIAAAGSVFLARAAFEEAIKQWPDQKLTLRQGIMLISEHPSPLGNPR